MNRRGIAIHFIVLLVVAVFVLAIVGFIFAPKAYGNISNFIDNIIPGFGNTTAEYEGSEILRYDLLTGELEYYDGVKGEAIEGEIIVNEKRVDVVRIKGEIEGFYYENRELPVLLMPFEDITLSVDIFYKILPSAYSNDVIPRASVLEYRALSSFGDRYFLSTIDDSLWIRVDNEIIGREVGELLDASTSESIFRVRVFDSGIQSIEDEFTRLKIGELDSLVLDTRDNLFYVYLDSGEIIKSKFSLDSSRYIKYEGEFLSAYIPEVTIISGTQKIFARSQSLSDYDKSTLANPTDRLIVSEVAKWRDSVLDQNIVLTHYNKEDKDRKSPITEEYDIERVDNFLVVDLSKTLNN